MGRLKNFDTQKGKDSVISLAYEGLTFAEIVDRLGLHKTTLYSWLKNDLKFRSLFEHIQSLNGRAAVEMGILRRAAGFIQEEETAEYKELRKIGGEEKEVSVKKVRRYYPPDTKALAMLARKYAPEYVEEKDDRTVTIRLTSDVSRLSQEDAQRILAADLRAAVPTTAATLQVQDDDAVSTSLYSANNGESVDAPRSGVGEESTEAGSEAGLEDLLG